MRPKRRARITVYSAASMLLAACSGPADASIVELLDDAAARLQYAFFTGDSRELQNVLQLIDDLKPDPAHAPMKSYYLAYGNWRLAQLQASDAAAGRAAATDLAASYGAARACVRHAQAAVETDAQMSEAYAILAACEGFSPDERDRPRCRDKPLRTAARMAPGAPRVLLIRTLCESARALPSSWRKVVAAFEAAPPRMSGQPDWGHAESLFRLGGACLRDGDMLAARDALERALVIAPDFRAARELLGSIAARSR